MESSNEYEILQKQGKEIYWQMRELAILIMSASRPQSNTRIKLEKFLDETAELAVGNFTVNKTYALKRLLRTSFGKLVDDAKEHITKTRNYNHYIYIQRMTNILYLYANFRNSVHTAFEKHTILTPANDNAHVDEWETFDDYIFTTTVWKWLVRLANQIHVGIKLPILGFSVYRILHLVHARYLLPAILAGIRANEHLLSII